MDYFGVVMSLIGIMFLSIVGVYGWTYKVSRDMSKELGNIYRIVNGHLQKPDIHVESKEFVSEDVCNALHGALKDDVVEIKRDVKKLLVKAGA